MPKISRFRIPLGRNLATARQENGWTQEQAAERAGLSLKYWQAIEGGEKAPAFSTLCRIRTVFGIDWNEPCRDC